MDPLFVLCWAVWLALFGALVYYAREIRRKVKG